MNYESCCCTKVVWTELAQTGSIVVLFSCVELSSSSKPYELKVCSLCEVKLHVFLRPALGGPLSPASCLLDSRFRGPQRQSAGGGEQSLPLPGSEALPSIPQTMTLLRNLRRVLVERRQLLLP